MKLPAILSIVCLLLLIVLNAASVESARHPSQYRLFVFGDSFADNGNLPRTDPITKDSRQWYYPYGSSYQMKDGADPTLNPTGRFSNYLVQPDFIAKMLGYSSAPPAYQNMKGLYCGPSGLNFAAGGATVYGVPEQPLSTLPDQIHAFELMIKRGTITKAQLKKSVALVAMSGRDYSTQVYNDIPSFIGNLTVQIASYAKQLQTLGVKMVLVNNLHPMGCVPSQYSHGKCAMETNMLASVHNQKLETLLGSVKDIHIVDLHSAFSNIVSHAHGEDSEVSREFKHKMMPCCQSSSPDGYCGQLGDSSEVLYSVCQNPDKYFFWDDMHPTHAGWEAVMKQLEGPIKEFLNLD